MPLHLKKNICFPLLFGSPRSPDAAILKDKPTYVHFSTVIPNVKHLLIWLYD